MTEEPENVQEKQENFSESGWFISEYKSECYDEDGNFDWEKYQELCDIADYWSME